MNVDLIQGKRLLNKKVFIKFVGYDAFQKCA